MFGWDSADDAKKAYLANFDPKWTGFGGITAMTQDEFKAWMDDDTTQPLTKDEGGASTTTTGHTQSSSPTSGITSYGMISSTKKRRRRVKLKPKEH